MHVIIYLTVLYVYLYICIYMHIPTCWSTQLHSQVLVQSPPFGFHNLHQETNEEAQNPNDTWQSGRIWPWDWLVKWSSSDHHLLPGGQILIDHTSRIIKKWHLWEYQKRGNRWQIEENTSIYGRRKTNRFWVTFQQGRFWEGSDPKVLDV